MEIKEFEVILSQLSSAKVKIPLLQTYFFANDMCKRTYFTDHQYLVNHTSTHIGGQNTVLISLLKDFEMSSRLKNIGKTICYIFTFAGRKQLQVQQARKILNGEKKVSNIQCIQKFKFQQGDESLYYTLDLSFKSIKYHSVFSAHCSLKKYVCDNAHLKDQAKAIARNILSALSQAHIPNLILEFIKDSNNKLWLRYIKAVHDPESPKNPEKTLEKIFIESPNSSYEEKPKSNRSSIIVKSMKILKKSKTFAERNQTRARTDKVYRKYEKQLTVIERESEQNLSKSSLSSSLSLEGEKELNFFEIIARERIKWRNSFKGRIRKTTPDNEILLAEIKNVKKDIHFSRLSAIKSNPSSPKKVLAMNSIKLLPILKTQLNSK